MKMKVAVVIPNWNGSDMIVSCIASLKAQTYQHTIIVVDNGSIDNSVALIENNFPDVTILMNSKNLGFAGGVNTGIRYAHENNFDAVALFNNDAIAHEKWLESLVGTLVRFSEAGIVTCKLMSIDKTHIDSTGDMYTTWGIPYPRGRDQATNKAHDEGQWIFGASGGASLYRSAMFKEVGLFDEDFFAYYEDVDISFRAQLAGWKVRYEPKAEAYHATSSTSNKLPGFAIFQSVKNAPMLFWKNVPTKLLPIMVPRFFFGRILFILRGLMTPGRTWPTLKGELYALGYLPKKLYQRRQIQSSRKVSDDYIASILTWDLPPNANKLRALRASFWKLTGKS